MLSLFSLPSFPLSSHLRHLKALHFPFTSSFIFLPPTHTPTLSSPSSIQFTAAPEWGLFILTALFLWCLLCFHCLSIICSHINPIYPLFSFLLLFLSFFSVPLPSLFPSFPSFLPPSLLSFITHHYPGDWPDRAFWLIVAI